MAETISMDINIADEVHLLAHNLRTLARGATEDTLGASKLRLGELLQLTPGEVEKFLASGHTIEYDEMTGTRSLRYSLD